MNYIEGFRSISFREYSYVSWPLPPSSNHRGSEDLGEGSLFPISVINAGKIHWIIDRSTIYAVPNASTAMWILQAPSGFLNSLTTSPSHGQDNVVVVMLLVFNARPYLVIWYMICLLLHTFPFILQGGIEACISRLTAT
jgi:hypothetical protein